MWGYPYMPFHIHEFLFDANFNVGTESVYTQVNTDMGPPFPKVEGFFLELNGGDFLLLNGQNLNLL
jgi:hypothetical protein